MGKYQCYNENKGLQRCDVHCDYCISLYGPRSFPGENRPKPWPLAKQMYMDLHIPDLPRPLVSKLEQLDEAHQKDFKIQLADFIERYLTDKKIELSIDNFEYIKQLWDERGRNLKHNQYLKTNKMRVQSFIQVCDTYIYVDQYRLHKIIRFTGSRKKTHPLKSNFNIGVWHIKYKL